MLFVSWEAGLAVSLQRHSRQEPQGRRSHARSKPLRFGAQLSFLPSRVLGGTALQQQWEWQWELCLCGQPGAGAGLPLHPQRGHGEDPAGRPARVGQEQLQGELAL